MRKTNDWLRPLELAGFLFVAGCSSGSVGLSDLRGAGADGAPSSEAGVDAWTDDAEQCEGTLCGQPAICCPPDNDCVEGACVAACDSGVRCGDDLEICCAATQVCLSGKCTEPGKPCKDSYDCEPGQFCEPLVGRCLPQPEPLTCLLQPEFDALEVTVEWSFESDQIISIPVVADLDGDQVPEVVVNLTMVDGTYPGGLIVVLDGQSGAEKLRIPHDPANGQYGSHGRTTIALGDVDGDQLPDIVYTARAEPYYSLIVAVNHAGTLLWRSHGEDGTDYPLLVDNGAVTLANLDGDPEAEVVIGATLIDNDGRVLWDHGGGGAGARIGGNDGYWGGISAVADLDLDGNPEIISGKNAWSVSYNAADNPPITVASFWTYAGADGYPAVADLDSDGLPEVVLVAASQIIALNGQSGELWCGVDTTDLACAANPALRTQPLDIPGGTVKNRGGPPTVADFDADGRPEIGVAGGYAYSVYDINRPGEQVFQPAGSPAPSQGALFMRWTKVTQDLSSNATGSSVFDFQGDGAAEVVYADECFMRVYSGTDGTVQLELPSTSATIHEYPLVVDVDADGNSEVLIVANEKADCPHASRQGLFVYGDKNDEWVPTRKVWTQHTYHVTNATSSGNVPLKEADNWTAAGLNNYRQNVQGDGVFNAPDLIVDLSVSQQLCNEGKLLLLARVSNQGALGVKAGIEVVFYSGPSKLGTQKTTQDLLPGASTTVSLAVPAPQQSTGYGVTVDGEQASTGVVVECNEENNKSSTTGVSCPVIK